MEKISVLRLLFLLIVGGISQGNAAVVPVSEPGIIPNYRQPINALVVDSAGNTYEQTVYYDPALGGVDLSAEWEGPYASVYFPHYGTRYLWSNGFWVDEGGQYRDRGRQVYVGDPAWKAHVVGYEHGRWSDNWRYSHPQQAVHVHERINVYDHEDYYRRQR